MPMNATQLEEYLLINVALKGEQKHSALHLKRGQWKNESAVYSFARRPVGSVSWTEPYSEVHCFCLVFIDKSLLSDSRTPKYTARGEQQTRRGVGRSRQNLIAASAKEEFVLCVYIVITTAVIEHTLYLRFLNLCICLN